MSENLQLYQKEIHIQVFIAKLLTLLISKNIWEQLLFDFFDDSLSHGPKGSRSRLYDGIRLQDLSRRSIILFLNWPEPSPCPRPVFENLRRISMMT